MPVHQRYQALLHAYAILASVPLDQGLLRRALAYVDAEFERANYAVVGSYEWTLIPMKDFPLTVEVRHRRLARPPAHPPACLPACLPAARLPPAILLVPTRGLAPPGRRRC